MQCTERIAVQDELVRLDEQIRQLHALRKRVQARLTPLSWIPVEILSNILEWVVALSPPVHCHGGGGRERVRAALTLSQINRHYRAVALATPSLWNHIDLSDARPHPLSCLLIQRSKACPLMLELDVNNMHEDDAEGALELIGREADRWKSFKLLANKVDDDLARRAFSIVSRTFANHNSNLLEDFELVGSPSLSSSTGIINCPTAPSLRYLTLKGISIDWSKASFPNLVELNLMSIRGPQCPSPSGLCQLLSTTRSLQKLSITGLALESSFLDETNPPNAVILHSLKSISITDTDLRLVYPLLSCIDAVNTQTLKLGPQCDASSSTLSDWSSIPSSLFRNVMTFDWETGSSASRGENIHYDANTRSYFDAVILRLPAAQRVTLSDRVALSLMIRLTRDPSTAPMTLPLLHSLSLRSMKNGLSDASALVDEREAAGLQRLRLLSLEAQDVMLPASAGQKVLEDIDLKLDRLRAMIPGVELCNLPKAGFRFTFAGWRDYRSHQSIGREIEYDFDMEE